MLTTFKATAKKLPEGLQVETQSRGFKVLMDEPKDLIGGTDASLNPVEDVLCALGACQAICAAAFARAQGIKLDDFSWSWKETLIRTASGPKRPCGTASRRSGSRCT